MRSYQKKTLEIIKLCQQVIGQYTVPVTVRQIYYRLVAAQVIENSLNSYKRLDAILSTARKDKLIGYDRIVDNTRRVIQPQSWGDLKDYFESIGVSYRRNLMSSQDVCLEVWLEKDALANQISSVTSPFCIPLVIGRGYQSLTFLNEASKRFDRVGTDIKILYLGDFDPSGEDIFRDIQDRLALHFDVVADFTKVALNQEDIKKYNLPPDFTKKTDTRSSSFIAKYGDVAVELDALPPDVLKQRVQKAIEECLDLDLFQEEQETEKEDLQKLEEILEGLDV